MSNTYLYLSVIVIVMILMFILVPGALDLKEVKQWQVTLCILYMMTSLPWALSRILLNGADDDKLFHLLYSAIGGVVLFDFCKNYVEDYVCLSKI